MYNLQEIVENKIKITKQKKARVLKLSKCNLTNIEFLQDKGLKQLTSIDLSHNNISDISYLGNLVKLNRLDLSHNKIKNIHNGLINLSKLEWLDLSNNEISDISNLSSYKTLKTLNLSNNNIENISGLKNCSKLSTLYLNNNQITNIFSLENLNQLLWLYLNNNGISDIKPLKKLKWVSILALGNNKIRDISPLKNLTQLTDLKLSSNKILNTHFLGKLNQLKALDLSNNQITDITFLETLTRLIDLKLSSNKILNTHFLGKLNQLKALDLSNNQIIDIFSLENLTQLTDLKLSGNKILNIHFLGKLNQLKVLDLSNNQITDIVSLENLFKLTHLNLGYNKISEIRFLGRLYKLEKLDLSNNQITDIDSLENLTQLKALDLSNNQITDIVSLENLSKLTHLNLGYNKVSEIRFLGRLYKLEKLDLSNNQITDIFFFKNLSKLEDVHLQENPLENPPPEIIKKGCKAIRNYFNKIEEQGKDKIYEAKLLIVGDGESGKTTLARKLKNINASLPRRGSDRTRGIDIQRIKVKNKDKSKKDFTINIWDFGGQEIYHATHQFFLSKRSLYLIVNNTRSGSTRFNYWLQTIQLLSDNSPIIIVQNEVGGVLGELDLKRLKRDFNAILFVSNVDLSNIKDGRLERLRQAIYREIQRLEFVGTELPARWIAIREYIEKLAEEEAYIDYSEFKKICEQHGLNYQEIETLTDLFHDLGIFLCFRDDETLGDWVILQHSWATKGVYVILDNKNIRQTQKGYFSYQDAIKIWQSTSFVGRQDILLRLMSKFELCYSTLKSSKEETYYVVPQLLPIGQPPDYEWDVQGNLIFYYDYEFIPKGFLSRLIVRMHKYIKNTHTMIWRMGCVFTYNKTDAQVMEFSERKRIEVRIKGDHDVDFAKIIVEEIKELNSKFSKMKVSKYIACNCSRCKESIEPYFYNYHQLLERVTHKKLSIESCKNNAYQQISILSLLRDSIGYNNGDIIEDLNKKDMIEYSQVFDYSNWLKENKNNSKNSLIQKNILSSNLINHLIISIFASVIVMILNWIFWNKYIPEMGLLVFCIVTIVIAFQNLKK